MIVMGWMGGVEMIDWGVGSIWGLGMVRMMRMVVVAQIWEKVLKVPIVNETTCSLDGTTQDLISDVLNGWIARSRRETNWVCKQICKFPNHPHRNACIHLSVILMAGPSAVEGKKYISSFAMFPLISKKGSPIHINNGPWFNNSFWKKSFPRPFLPRPEPLEIWIQAKSTTPITANSISTSEIWKILERASTITIKIWTINPTQIGFFQLFATKL